jgi:hypothetical protein
MQALCTIKRAIPPKKQPFGTAVQTTNQKATILTFFGVVRADALIGGFQGVQLGLGAIRATLWVVRRYYAVTIPKIKAMKGFLMCIHMPYKHIRTHTYLCISTHIYKKHSYIFCRTLHWRSSTMYDKNLSEMSGLEWTKNIKPRNKP